MPPCISLKEKWDKNEIQKAKGEKTQQVAKQKSHTSEGTTAAGNQAHSFAQQLL